MRRYRYVLALVVIATLLLGACGHRATPQSGVAGIVTINQGGFQTKVSTASPLPGGFGVSTDVPVAGALVSAKALTGPQADHIVAHVKADAHGLFRLSLPPGSYSLFTMSGPVANSGTVVLVQAGHFTRVVVSGGVRY